MEKAEATQAEAKPRSSSTRPSSPRPARGRADAPGGRAGRRDPRRDARPGAGGAARSSPPATRRWPPNGSRSSLRGRSAGSPPNWPASSSASPSRTTPGRAAPSTGSSTSSRRRRQTADRCGPRAAADGGQPGRPHAASLRDALAAQTGARRNRTRPARSCWPRSWSPSPRCSTASSSLRRALTDPAQPGEAKAELAGGCFAGSVGGHAVDARLGAWRSPLVAPARPGRRVEELGDRGGLRRGAARRARRRRGRAVPVRPDRRRQRRAAPASWATGGRSAEAKAALLGGLLAARSSRSPSGWSRSVADPRARQPRGRDRVLSKLPAAARAVGRGRDRGGAAQRQQKQRLGAALGRHLRPDGPPPGRRRPEVLGGLVVHVGDEVIDGSIAAPTRRPPRRLAG